MTEEPEGTYNELSYDTGGVKIGGVGGLFVDKLHLYKDLDADNAASKFSQSLGPYYRNMQRKARHSQKYFNPYQTHSTNAVSISSTDFTVEYNYESVRLVDIVPELLHLGQLSMIDKTVRIDL